MPKSVAITEENCWPVSGLTPEPEPASPAPYSTSSNGGGQGSFDMEEFARRHGLRIKSIEQHRGATKYILEECPFDSSHRGKDAALFLYPDGKLGFKCFHDSCSSHKWKDLRQKLEPGCYDKDKAARQKKNGDESTPPIIRRLEDAILSAERFAKSPDDKLYVWRDGVYTPYGSRVVAAAVKSLLRKWNIEKEWGTRLTSETEAYITIDSPELWERPPLDRINLANGILTVASKLVLLPHDPEFLSPIQLPISYDPLAACPNIDKFISEVFPADAVQLGYEIPAWLMLPDTDIQKAILFHGPGGDGKSTYLELIKAFIGRCNASGVSLHRLESDRFSPVRLHGKLANICADLPAEHLAGTSVFKAITGGDALVGERKFHPSFEFYPYARLLFSANSLPRSADASKGFFDRWLVLPFCGSFRGTAAEIARAELDARLSAPGELSGLLNKALNALPGLRKRGFSQPASVVEAAKQFRGLTDPLAVWLDRFTFDDPDATTPRDQVRIAFNAALERKGCPPMTDQEFGRSFAVHRPAVESRQRTVGPRKNVWCYVGIGLTPANEQTPQNKEHL